MNNVISVDDVDVDKIINIIMGRLIPAPIGLFPKECECIVECEKCIYNEDRYKCPANLASDIYEDISNYLYELAEKTDR